MASRDTRSQADPEPTAPEPEPVTKPKPKRRRGLDESRRRHAIHELFVNLGEPEQSKWKGKGGTVSEIRKALRSAMMWSIRSVMQHSLRWASSFARHASP